MLEYWLYLLPRHQKMVTYCHLEYQKMMVMCVCVGGCSEDKGSNSFFVIKLLCDYE